MKTSLSYTEQMLVCLARSINIINEDNRPTN